MHEVRTYKEFNSNIGFTQKIRAQARRFAIAGLSLNRNIANTNNWVRFPLYHHVFDDEIKGFERQLNYLKNYGDFISMDEACDLISESKPMKGRYFAVGFDDGFKNCYSNMLDITSRLDIPVIIYLPTNYIGLSLEKAEDVNKIKQFYPEGLKIVPFLTWENCQEMLDYKISFGSHTCDHTHLIKASESEIEIELKDSKRVIEEKLNIKCDHFACPWGRIGIDFDPKITTEIAKKVGYRSFVASNRGKSESGADLYTLKRDHLLANWETFQLKYFLGI